MGKLGFASDYMEGAAPAIMERLVSTNLLHTVGYGCDEYSEAAREKIRKACGTLDADVHFLIGGTQANETVIDALLDSYQGVIAAETGHINVHEAGAVEYNGHKVLTLPEVNGKIRPSDLKEYLLRFFSDDSFEHMVFPGMVYLSHPTELGTLYSLKELEEISAICKEFKIHLYVDGARLAYALGCPENDISLTDLGRLCDAFYIGGTKCGALFGEAVVVPDKKLIPHFFTIIKQHGALLAKGRISGIQFDTLFTDDLYLKLGRNGIETADRLRKGLIDKNYRFFIETPTNQIFIIIDNEKLEKLKEVADISIWQKYDDKNTVIRLATGWATLNEDVDKLLEVL
ncbi:MAG: aminotransferase class V-fold PLP-dependent enzyme [Lachnospiraceae bacterium]|nr:aminotransferase class V-fold PLP-dependent enzyme [Lachnospiraceae bacterium]